MLRSAESDEKLNNERISKKELAELEEYMEEEFELMRQESLKEYNNMQALEDEEDKILKKIMEKSAVEEET